MLQVLPDISEDEVARVFTALDVDHTGSIDLNEFFAGGEGAQGQGAGGHTGSIQALYCLLLDSFSAGLLHTMDADLQSSLAKKSYRAMDV